MDESGNSLPSWLFAILLVGWVGHASPALAQSVDCSDWDRFSAARAPIAEAFERFAAEQRAQRSWSEEQEQIVRGMAACKGDRLKEKIGRRARYVTAVADFIHGEVQSQLLLDAQTEAESETHGRTAQQLFQTASETILRLLQEDLAEMEAAEYSALQLLIEQHMQKAGQRVDEWRKRREATRRGEEARRAEEARRDEQARQDMEAQRLEEARRAERARKDEKVRQTEQAQRNELARKAQQERDRERAIRTAKKRRADAVRGTMPSTHVGDFPLLVLAPGLTTPLLPFDSIPQIGFGLQGSIAPERGPGRFIGTFKYTRSLWGYDWLWLAVGLGLRSEVTLPKTNSPTEWYVGFLVGGAGQLLHGYPGDPVAMFITGGTFGAEIRALGAPVSVRFGVEWGISPNTVGEGILGLLGSIPGTFWIVPNINLSILFKPNAWE